MKGFADTGATIRLSLDERLDVPDEAELLDLVGYLPDLLEAGDVDERHVIVVAEHRISVVDALNLVYLARFRECLLLEHDKNSSLPHVSPLTSPGTLRGSPRSRLLLPCRSPCRCRRSSGVRGHQSLSQRPIVRGQGMHPSRQAASSPARRPSWS